MTINWEAWDSLDEIPLWAAACLWAGLEPTHELRDSPPPYLEDLMQAIVLGTMKYSPDHGESYTAITEDGTPVRVDPSKQIIIHERRGGGVVAIEVVDRFPDYIPRLALLKLAGDKGIKPKFLFPEMRTKGAETTTQKPKDKPLHPKERNSYLKLIKGLLIELEIDLSDRAPSKKLVGIVERAQQKLGADKISDIWKEVRDLPTDS